MTNKNPSLRLDKHSAAYRQRGLSLVELMISLTIGLILLAGITSLIVKQSTTRNELEKSSRQIENGRYAVELLGDDIEHAEFYGEYSPIVTTVYDETANPCTADTSGWVTATPSVPVGVYGYAGGATAPLGCLSNYKPNTAVLVVRRVTTQSWLTADPQVVDGRPYLQVSRCDEPGALPYLMTTTKSQLTLKQKDCVAPASVRGYIVRIYYVATCNVCGTGGDATPTLKMVEYADGAQATRPLVEGIENIQFDYGVDTTGDGAPDSYAQTVAAGQWHNVMAVRVNVLARNTETTPGYVDTKSYTLSGVTGVAAVGPFNDAYKRHAYAQVVRLINPSGRREQP